MTNSMTNWSTKNKTCVWNYDGHAAKIRQPMDKDYKLGTKRTWKQRNTENHLERKKNHSSETAPNCNAMGERMDPVDGGPSHFGVKSAITRNIVKIMFTRNKIINGQSENKF